LGPTRGFPEQAFDTIVTLLARIYGDPYDPVFSISRKRDISEHASGLGQRLLRFLISHDMPIRLIGAEWELPIILFQDSRQV
jgi:hypothetical protein